MKLAGTAALQTRLFERTFCPPGGGIRNPRIRFQAPPIFESQLINLVNGTPLEGSLFTVKRILDFMKPLIWQSQICRAETRGLREAGRAAQPWLPLGFRSPAGGTKRAPAKAPRGRGMRSGLCGNDELQIWGSRREKKARTRLRARRGLTRDQEQTPQSDPVGREWLLRGQRRAWRGPPEAGVRIKGRDQVAFAKGMPFSVARGPSIWGQRGERDTAVRGQGAASPRLKGRPQGWASGGRGPRRSQLLGRGISAPVHTSAQEEPSGKWGGGWFSEAPSRRPAGSNWKRPAGAPRARSATPEVAQSLLPALFIFQRAEPGAARPCVRPSERESTRRLTPWPPAGPAPPGACPAHGAHWSPRGAQGQSGRGARASGAGRGRGGAGARAPGVRGRRSERREVLRSLGTSRGAQGQWGRGARAPGGGAGGREHAGGWRRRGTARRRVRSRLWAPSALGSVLLASAAAAAPPPPPRRFLPLPERKALFFPFSALSGIEGAEGRGVPAHI